MSKNRTMKPVEIILRSGEWDTKGRERGVNLTIVHYIDVWKYII
jgi:hypothetical protein